MQDFHFFGGGGGDLPSVCRCFNRPPVCLLQINLNPTYTILQAGVGWNDERKGLASLGPLALPQGEYQLRGREGGKIENGEGERWFENWITRRWWQRSREGEQTSQEGQCRGCFWESRWLRVHRFLCRVTLSTGTCWSPKHPPLMRHICSGSPTLCLALLVLPSFKYRYVQLFCGQCNL